jgi:hypothetical protein
MNKVTTAQLEKAIDYATYRKLINDLFAAGKSTGPDNSPEILHYTELNIARMNRVEKTVTLSDELLQALKNIKHKQQWIVISEGWCGDAAQIVPLFHIIEKHCDMIDLKFLLRDENLDLIDQYLTNGGRAIPKLLIVDAPTNNVLTHWGPRPKLAQQLINDMQAAHIDMAEIKEKLHLWYARDRAKAIQQELTVCLSILEDKANEILNLASPLN